MAEKLYTCESCECGREEFDDKVGCILTGEIYEPYEIPAQCPLLAWVISKGLKPENGIWI